MDLHLVKPFDPAVLEAMLGKMDGRPVWPTPCTPRLRHRRSTSEAPPNASGDGAAIEPEPAAMPGDESRVEAARYALFAGSAGMRHGLVGELQSVQFAVNLARHTASVRRPATKRWERSAHRRAGGAPRWAAGRQSPIG